MTEAHIFEALRTPRGRQSLYEVKPVDLLSAALRALQERLSLDPAAVDDLLVGCVLPVDDQGANLPRAALLHAGWSPSVSGLQLHRAGASGLEAVSLAATKVRSGWSDLVLAGGVESVSRVPAGSDGGPMAFDPEILNRTDYLPPGIAADLIATIGAIGREQVDAYALRSRRLAGEAREKGYFRRALVPIHDRNGMVILDTDEFLDYAPGPDELAALPPAFREAGRRGYDDKALYRYPLIERIRHVHTTGNCARPADGAALVLVGSLEKGEALGLPPRARIRSAATVSVPPALLLTGAVPAARRALTLAGMQPGDIDLWECDEAFAAPVIHFQRELKVKTDRLNVNGGAIALGHPPGAAGAMLLGALLDELERRGLRTGLAASVSEGGAGVAVIIERT